MEQQQQQGNFVTELQNDEENEDSIFADPTTDVEVRIDDDDAPMDDDDDDNNNNNDNNNNDQNGVEEEPVTDMSKVTLSSHSGQPVYSVDSYWDNSTQTLHVASGGGDDRAYRHFISFSNTSTTTTTATTTTNTSSATNTRTIPLDQAHTDSVSCVRMNYSDLITTKEAPGARPLLAVGSYDGTVVLYDANTGEKIKVLDGPTDVEFVSFHPKGGTVFLAGSMADGTAWMFHTPTFKCMQVFVGHESTTSSEGTGGGGGITSGSFTPDGKFALTCGMDGTLRLWAPRSGLCKHVFRFDSDFGGRGLTCMDVGGGKDGQLVATGCENGMVYISHLASKKVIATLQHHTENNMDTGSSAMMTTTTTTTSTTTQMDTDDGAEDGDEEEQQTVMKSVEAVGFSPSSSSSTSLVMNWIATGGVDGTLKIWDLTHGQIRRICRPPLDEGGAGAGGGGITRLKWHPRLPLVFASYSDGTVRIWDVRSGDMAKELTGGILGVMINDLSIQFVLSTSEDGSSVERAFIVTAMDNGTVRVFDVNINDMLSTNASGAAAGTNAIPPGSSDSQATPLRSET